MMKETDKGDQAYFHLLIRAITGMIIKAFHLIQINAWRSFCSQIRSVVCVNTGSLHVSFHHKSTNLDLNVFFSLQSFELNPVLAPFTVPQTSLNKKGKSPLPFRALNKVPELFKKCTKKTLALKPKLTVIKHNQRLSNLTGLQTQVSQRLHCQH